MQCFVPDRTIHLLDGDREVTLAKARAPCETTRGSPLHELFFTAARMVDARRENDVELREGNSPPPLAAKLGALRRGGRIRSRD